MAARPLVPRKEEEDEEGRKKLPVEEKPRSVIKPKLFVVGVGEGEGQGLPDSCPDPLPKSLVARMLPCDDDEEDWDRENSRGDSDQGKDDDDDEEEEEEEDVNRDHASASNTSSISEYGGGDQDGGILVLQPHGEEEFQVRKEQLFLPSRHDPLPTSLIELLLPSGEDDEGWDFDHCLEESYHGKEHGVVECQDGDSHHDQETATETSSGSEYGGDDEDGEKLQQQVQGEFDGEEEDYPDQVIAEQIVERHYEEATGNKDPQPKEDKPPVQTTGGGAEPGLVMKSTLPVPVIPPSSHDALPTSLIELLLPSGEDDEDWDLDHCRVEAECQDGDIPQDEATDSGRNTASGIRGGVQEDDNLPHQTQEEDELKGEEDPAQANAEDDGKASILETGGGVQEDDKLQHQTKEEDELKGEEDPAQANAEDDGKASILETGGGVQEDDKLQHQTKEEDELKGEEDPAQANAQEDVGKHKDNLSGKEEKPPGQTTEGGEPGEEPVSVDCYQAQDDSEQAQEDFELEEGTLEQLYEDMYGDPTHAQDRKERDDKDLVLQRFLRETAHMTAAETAAKIQEFNLANEQFCAHSGYPSGSTRGQVRLPSVYYKTPDNVLHQHGSKMPTPFRVTPSQLSEETPTHPKTLPQEAATASTSLASTVASTTTQPHHSKNHPSTSFTQQPSCSSKSVSSSGSSHAESQSSSLGECSDNLLYVNEDRSIIRSTFVVGDVEDLTVYVYKITTASENMSLQARDELIRSRFAKFSVFEDEVYAMYIASPLDEPMTISRNDHVITLLITRTEPPTSENFRKFFQERMEEIVGVSNNLFRMGPAKWLFCTPPRDAFPVHHLRCYDLVELQVKVVGQRIFASLRDGIFVVHTTPVRRLLVATTSHARTHQAFVAMTREKLLGRTIVHSQGLNLNIRGWRILKIDGVRPQAEGGQVRNFRLLCGDQEEVDPASSYLVGYSNWEVNDTTVYPKLLTVLERSPQTSYDVRQAFLTEMRNSAVVQQEMRDSGLTVNWNYLEERMTFLPVVTLQFDGNVDWRGVGKSFLNWTTESLRHRFWLRGQSNVPWSYVSSSLNRDEREDLLDSVFRYLNRDDVTLAPMLPEIVNRSFQQALLNALTSIQGGYWKPEVLLVFIPWNNVGPILPFLKTMLEVYQVNCIIVPPLKTGRVDDAAKRIARTLNIKLGGIPWKIRDFPTRTMLLSVVSGMTRGETPRKVFAAAATFGLSIANNVSFVEPDDEDASDWDIAHGQAITQAFTSVISCLTEEQDFETPTKIIVYSDKSLDLMAMVDYIGSAIFGVLPLFANPELILVQVSKRPYDMWCEQRYPNRPVRNVSSGVFHTEGSGFYLQSTTNKEGGNQQPAHYQVMNINPSVNLVDLANTTYQASFQHYHGTEPTDVPAILVYSQDSLFYAEHGVGEGIVHLPLIMGFFNRS